ncbi:MAG: hypothetical protein CW716_00770 [Candidatus Bathyarchaeum sp.]|nr:MAG: hypothetical protein CW716_00770 [Candidatus Bathyarchaeum sp.]
MLIDKTKDYTNLLVLQSGPVSKNETATNIICDYAVDAGLDVIVFFGWFDPDCPWQLPWLNYAKERWGDSFLGVYFYDEPGGIQLDGNWSIVFRRAEQLWPDWYKEVSTYLEESSNHTVSRDYADAAEGYVNYVIGNLRLSELTDRSITSFTSDYALYWFDYLGGYDVVFAEFGWNNSVAQEIALVRGAAQLQNKDWGAIITWKYEQPPYLDTGEEIFMQMQTALESGAKYIVLFNYPTIEGNLYGTLIDSHFEALKRTWELIESMPRTTQNSLNPENVLVLPENYGYGMRSVKDKIWFWEPDEECLEIWNFARFMLNQKGLNIDIVYEHQDYSHANTYATCLIA